MPRVEGSGRWSLGDEAKKEMQGPSYRTVGAIVGFGGIILNEMKCCWEILKRRETHIICIVKRSLWTLSRDYAV